MMAWKSLRRRLALALCPELSRPHQVGAPPANPRAQRMPTTAQQQAEMLRRLDGLYTAHTGIRLNLKIAPPYRGSMYEWECDRADVVRRSMNALARVRIGRNAGIHPNTGFKAQNYLASIWPADLNWPTDIPRPPMAKEVA